MAKREDRPMREPQDEFVRKLIAVNRVTKVVKGGRNMRFSALV
ncbi:MAG TPA: 30S ribosomal protein S5, partial [Clostridia bacterium]|nr:30S ribosomal protein S5 [Clostridia bacterium]